MTCGLGARGQWRRLSLSPEVQESEEEEAGDRESRVTGRRWVGHWGAGGRAGRLGPLRKTLLVCGLRPPPVTPGWPVPPQPCDGVDSILPAMGHRGRRADLTVDSSASPSKTWSRRGQRLGTTWTLVTLPREFGGLSVAGPPPRGHGHPPALRLHPESCSRGAGLGLKTSKECDRLCTSPAPAHALFWSVH